MSVFLSYSRRDADLVSRIYGDLESQGIQVWMDRQAIEAGSLWRTSIVDGIQSCQVFLLVVSEASQQSSNVAKEVSLAESNRKPILPLKIDATQIQPDFGYSLAGLQFVDMHRKGYENSLLELLQAIRRLAAEPESAGSLASGLPTAMPQINGAALAAPQAPDAKPQPPALAEAAGQPEMGDCSPQAAMLPRQSGTAPVEEQSHLTPLSHESMAGIQQLCSEELGPVVALLWSEDFGRDLLAKPEAIVAKLLGMGVPEATALRLRRRLQPFL